MTSRFGRITGADRRRSERHARRHRTCVRWYSPCPVACQAAPMSKTRSETSSFRALNIAEPLLKALDEIGYETPSPIQAQAVPPLLEGKDLLGHAPTGTGKTAAFALPLLSRLDKKKKSVQIMTLT